MKRTTNLLCLISFLVFLGTAGNAQNMIEANPANYQSSNSAFINPAIIMLQSKQVSAGIRLLQLGFLENNSAAFKHSFLSYSQPFSMWPKTGFGVTAQYLSTSFYNQGNYSLIVARRFNELFSLGTHFNVLSKNYDLTHAILESPNDPVFSGNLTKYFFSFGVGMIISPVTNFTLGIALDHLNRPNIVMSGKPLHQPLTFDFGLHYTYNYIGPSVYVNYQDNQTVTTYGIEFLYQQLGTAGLFYGNRNLILETKLNLMGQKLKIGYRMDFPFSDLNEYSAGSYLLSLAYCFSEPIDADFDILASVEHLNVIEKRITVEADKGIQLEDINSLAEYHLDIFDETSLERIKDSSKVADITSVGDRSGAQLDDASYKYYKQTLTEMIEQKIVQTGGKTFKVDIDSPPGTGKRALALLNYLVDTLGIASENVNIVFSPDYTNHDPNYINPILEAIKTSKQDADSKMKRVKVALPGKTLVSDDQTLFRIRRLRSTKPVHSWRIIIENNQKVIKKIIGVKEPREIAWDWKDEGDHLVDVGEYFYSFQWKDTMSGDWKPSRPKKKLLFVDKEVQDENIFLTKDGRPPVDNPNIQTDKLEFLLKGTKQTQTTTK
jgi:hypothetical protein